MGCSHPSATGSGKAETQGINRTDIPDGACEGGWRLGCAKEKLTPSCYNRIQCLPGLLKHRRIRLTRAPHSCMSIKSPGCLGKCSRAKVVSTGKRSIWRINPGRRSQRRRLHLNIFNQPGPSPRAKRRSSRRERPGCTLKCCEKRQHGLPWRGY